MPRSLQRAAVRRAETLQDLFDSYSLGAQAVLAMLTACTHDPMANDYALYRLCGAPSRNPKI